MEFVYMLYHTHIGVDGIEINKLLGLYSSEALASARLESARTLPGFRDCPEGLEVFPQKLDRDGWIEGYAELDGLDVPTWFAESVTRADPE